MTLQINTNTNKNNTNKYTTQQQVACSGNAVSLNFSCVTGIENNTHLKLSNNQFKKVSNWDIDRLRKAIKIFKEQQGQYFALLEKIYLDNGNFVPKSNKSNTNSKNSANFTQRKYDYDKLEAQLLGWEDIETEEETKQETIEEQVKQASKKEQLCVELLNYMESKIGKVPFKTWILPYVKETKTQIIIDPDNNFTKGIIDKRYLGIIKEYATNTGKEIICN